jgi:hypothetical protein
MEYAQLKALVSPRLTLKGIKTFKGMDGVGLNVDIYFDGKKVAFGLDEGCGGGMYFQWLVPAKQDEVDTFITSLNIPADVVKYDGVPDFEMEYDLEQIVNTMVDGIETEKKFRKICKTKTLLRLTDGNFLTYNIAFSPRVKELLAAKGSEILKKHGAAIAAFVNEELV